jgi:hypothetical protein
VSLILVELALLQTWLLAKQTVSDFSLSTFMGLVEETEGVGVNLR